MGFKPVAAERVKRVREADGWKCEDCGHFADRTHPYWDISKTRWMHEHGMGHRTTLYRLAFDEAGSANLYVLGLVAICIIPVIVFLGHLVAYLHGATTLLSC